jgi:type I restriction enzyme, S subunit
MSSEDLVSPIECPESWRLATLKSICKKVGSGATPTGGQAAYQHRRTNFALVRSQNVFDREFSEAGLAFISDEQAVALKNVRLEPNDILLNITGDGITFGRACLVPEQVLPACVNQHVSIVRLDSQQADPGYVVSYLTHPTIKSYIESFNAGGSRRAITKAHIESFVVPLPPLETQNAIAELLGALDDRITLLRETNATLEAIAQALFKSWFVDFDPVRAKMEGRAPEGMDEATAALFPDEFEESALGAVPKGWQPRTFRETIDIIGGGTPKTSNPDFWSGNIPWFSVVDAPSASDVFVIDTEKHITEAGLHGSSTKLLPAGTTIISARGTVGRLALTGCPMAMNQSCYGLRGRAGDSYFTFFSTTRLVQQLQQKAHGSVFDTITQESFSGVHLNYPNEEAIVAFDGTVEPLMMRIRENLQQAQILATLRDTLLPRLISGQLRLPEAQAHFEEVAA